MARLRDVEKDYKRASGVVWGDRSDEIIMAIQVQEMAEKRTKVKHISYER